MFKNFGLTKAQVLKVLKVTAYVAVSTAIGGTLAIITANPLAFGVVTPIVNVLLVTVEQLLKAPQN